MTSMFNSAGYNSTPITLDLSNWNTLKVSKKYGPNGYVADTGMGDMFKDMRRLQSIKLGSNFSITGDGTAEGFALPEIDTEYFTNSDGNWYNQTTGQGYAPNAIPTNTAATYSVEKPTTAFAVYSETDNSLRFYSNNDTVTVGGTYRDKVVTSLYEGIETATTLSKGKVIIDVVGANEVLFSESFACPYCDYSLEELEPRIFSFNAPYGSCEDCKGLGVKSIINSPTFTIMKIHQGKMNLYHMDVYRLDNSTGDDYLEEYFYMDGVCVIEWADNLSDIIPNERLEIYIKNISDTQRELTIIAKGEEYEKLVERVI